jgi:hypothetical protein
MASFWELFGKAWEKNMVGQRVVDTIQYFPDQFAYMLENWRG